MTLNGITEAEAFNALQAGDERGLDYFFNSYYSQLCFYCQSLMHNASAAQEIASEAFVKLWNYRTTLTESSKVKALLFRIGYNASIDYIREQQTRTKHTVNFFSQPADHSENTALQKLTEAETFHHICQLLHHLPPRTRQIFVLFYFGERSHQEIARELGLTVATVRGLKARAVHMLREHLGPTFVIIICFSLFFS